MQRAASHGTAVTVLLVAAAGWLALAGRTAGMPAQPGPMGLGPAAFVGLWALMMAAMMLPVVAPVASMYAGRIAVHSRGLRRPGRIAAMVAGYVGVWSSIGVLAYAGTLAARGLATTHPDGAAWAASALFAGTAAYQLSPLRARCLSHCRAPFALLFRMTAGRRRLRDLRAGLVHGAVCTACCLPLMACLLALGAMSLSWMAVLSAVVAAERHPTHGRWVSYAAAAGLVALAVAVPFHPGLAPGLHRPAAPMGM